MRRDDGFRAIFLFSRASRPVWRLASPIAEDHQRCGFWNWRKDLERSQASKQPTQRKTNNSLDVFGAKVQH